MTVLGNTLIFDITDIEFINDCYHEIHKIINTEYANLIYNFLYEYNRCIKNNTKFIIKFTNVEITIIPLSKRTVMLECSDKMFNIKIDIDDNVLFYKRYIKRAISIYLYKLLKVY